MICLGGCAGGGGEDDAGLPDGEEIQTGDDGQAGDDAGIPGDDAAEVPLELTLEPITSWQRGPVRVAFSLSGRPGEIADLYFDYTTDGQTLHPATVLTGYADAIKDIDLDPGGVSGVFVWDSKHDVSTDETAVRILATLDLHGDHIDFAPVASNFFELLNAPDRDRPVVVPHPGYDAQGNIGNTASLLVLRPDGVLEDTGEDMECGPGPTLATFTADGRHGMVLGEGYGHNEHTLAPFLVNRDGTITRLGGTIDIRELGFSASNLVPTPDGSGIWMTHYTGEGGLYLLSFEGGSPHILPAEPSGYNQFPLTIPAAMAILPDNRRAIISGGALIIDDPPYDITLVDLFSGNILDQQVMGVGSLAEKIAVTSDGTRALIPSADPWGPDQQMMVVSLGLDRVESWLEVAVPQPSWVFIHPDDGAALVTSWANDSVTILNLSVDPPVATHTISNIPFADRLDCVREGPLAGLCLVTAVTELAVIWLENDGTASVDTPFSFGSGVGAMVSGPAIFP